MTRVTISLPRLHEAQRDIAADTSRYRVAVCGRRFGKSLLAGAVIIRKALRGQRCWWLAPTYQQTLETWRMVKNTLRSVPLITISEANRVIYLPTGGSIAVRSTAKDENLRGQGLDFAVLDEAAFMDEDIWPAVVRPMLLERRGGALFISTPKGRNWFFDLYTQALKGGDWRAFQYPSNVNPLINESEFEMIRQTTPERIFKEEYLAEFLEDSGSVFRRVREAVTVANGSEPIPGDEYVFGVDWGRSVDYTAVVVIHAYTKRVVAIDHFNEIGWDHQRGRLQALYDYWRPKLIVAEENNMGMMLEALQGAGLPVKPFRTSAQSKRMAIESLALAIETNEIQLLDDDRLVAELLTYEMEQTITGAIRYNAPAGKHDDLVIALALAWNGVAGGRAISFVEAPSVLSNWRG